MLQILGLCQLLSPFLVAELTVAAPCQLLSPLLGWESIVAYSNAWDLSVAPFFFNHRFDSSSFIFYSSDSLSFLC